MTTENASTPNPAPTLPVTAKESKVENRDVLADIAPGGLLDQLLEKSRRESSGGAASLNEELTSSVKAMRDTEFRQVRYGNLKRESLPRWLVRVQGHEYRADAVLRYCLGQHWGIEDTDGELRSDALKQYQDNPNGYDLILADLLPATFREEARAILAQTNFDLGSNRTAAEDWDVYRRRLKRRQGRMLLGLSTGLNQLDLALGGLRGLTFLGGGPGVGKTSLALFMAIQALRKDPHLAVLFYSLDMPKSVLYDRLLCLEAGIPYGELLREPEGAANQQLVKAESRLQAEVLPRLRVVERLEVSKDKSSFKVMKDDIDQLDHIEDVTRVLIVVDYFQLLPVPEGANTAQDADFHRVNVLQRLQEWTRTNWNPAGYPILAISEVRKGESGRNEISVGDLMGSARLGYSADSILLLETTKEVEGPVVPVQLKVAKGRDGAERARIDLLFEHAIYRFREAPTSRSRHQGGKVGKAAPVQKADPSKVDPLAGLEGNP